MKMFLAIAVLAALLVSYGCVSQNGNGGAPPVIVGNDSDVHGCKASAGYSWCSVLQKCLRTWEENCTNTSVRQPCTDEAKICPDGSAVGRQGLNCEFAPCPPRQGNCPQDVQTCPDGSTVGRGGPNCTFAACQQGCSKEAKTCPDGSIVGRNPSLNCAFNPCPPGNYTLYGKITIGPLCPVEPCSRVFDYSVARVNVYDAASRNKVAQASADSSGYYGFRLGQGNYLVNVTDADGNPFGLAQLDYTQLITIEKGHVVEMDFDIDTGIR